jgi:hypothetical protein
MTREEYNKRIETCKSCPIYSDKWGTCGVPTDAINPFKTAVELDGILFKPCGCPVEHKAVYAVSKCPANKWPEISQKSLQEETLDYIAELKKRNRLVPGDMAKIYQLRKDVLGINDGKTGTSCPPCLEKIVNDIETKLLQDIKQQSKETSIEAPKKTIKRTKKKKGGTDATA